MVWFPSPMPVHCWRQVSNPISACFKLCPKSALFIRGGSREGESNCSHLPGWRKRFVIAVAPLLKVVPRSTLHHRRVGGIRKSSCSNFLLCTALALLSTSSIFLSVASATAPYYYCTRVHVSPSPNAALCRGLVSFCLPHSIQVCVGFALEWHSH